MIKAILFDMDGTLAETIESIAGACNRVLADYGYEGFLRDDYRYFIGDGARVLVERAMNHAVKRAQEKTDGADTKAAITGAGVTYASKELCEEAYRKYQIYFRETCADAVYLYEGMKETLDALKEQHIRLGVVTNKPHERALDVVRVLVGEHYFDEVLGQMDSIPKKPAKDMPLAVAGALKVLPSECLYVGDTAVDMQTGHAAGMFTIGVLWGYRTREELEKNHADAIIAHPRELFNYL